MILSFVLALGGDELTTPKTASALTIVAGRPGVLVDAAPKAWKPPVVEEDDGTEFPDPSPPKSLNVCTPDKATSPPSKATLHYATDRFGKRWSSPDEAWLKVWIDRVNKGQAK